MLVSCFGYNRDTLTSNNAVIPIAYYLKKNGNPKNFELASRYKNDRFLISTWLTISLLKRVFGGQPDNLLRPLRQVLSESNSSFPFIQIVEKLKGGPNTIIFTMEEIESLLDSEWGQKYTFSTLSLLYSTLDYRNKFHIDHIFPRHLFTEKKLLKLGIAEDQVWSYILKRDSLANLQLLEGLPNQEKTGQDFKKWFYETYPTETERKDYLKKHYIPDVDLEIGNFLEFFEKRESLIRERLKEILIPSELISET
jgi:hypothetical protein